MVCGIVFLATSLPSTDRTPVPPLAMPGPSYLKSNTMVCLPGVERLRAFPAESFQTEEVVGEDRLALEQVETIAPEAPAKRVEHSFGTARGNFHLGGDGVGLAESVLGALPSGKPDISPE